MVDDVYLLNIRGMKWNKLNLHNFGIKEWELNSHEIRNQVLIPLTPPCHPINGNLIPMGLGIKSLVSERFYILVVNLKFEQIHNSIIKSILYTHVTSIYLVKANLIISLVILEKFFGVPRALLLIYLLFVCVCTLSWLFEAYTWQEIHKKKK